MLMRIYKNGRGKMKLIRKLGTRIVNGWLESWGEFLCEIFECGKIVERKLSAGKEALSCGCNRNKAISKARTDHGESKTRLYNIWNGILGRCLNFKTPNYKYYGGRGIKVCDEWLEFIPFRDWAVSNGYAEGLQIHRENDGNYEPYSCRWVTKTENLRYTRKTTTLEIANEIRVLYKTGKYTQQELADRFNIKRSTVSHITN